MSAPLDPTRRLSLAGTLLVLFAGVPAQRAEAQRSLPDSAAALVAKADTLRKSQARPGQLEALALYRQAATIYSGLGNGHGQREALNRSGWTLEALDRRDSALSVYHEIYRLGQRDKDPGSQAAALSNVGAVMRDLGHPDSAIAYYRMALAIPDLPPDPKGESATLNNLGLSYMDMGQTDSALAIYGRAVILKRSVKDRNGEAIVLSNLARTFDDMGLADSAVVYQRQSLVLRRDLGDRAGQSTSLNSLGILFRRLGQPDSALVYLGQAYDLAQAIDNRTLLGIILNNISNVLKDQGKLDSALRTSKAAYELRRAVGNVRGQGITANNIGEQYIHLGMPDSALVYLRIALVIARQVHAPANELTALNNLGIIFMGLGRPDSAEAAFKTGLALARGAKDKRGEGDLLLSLAEASREQKKLGIALALFDSAAAARSALRARAGADVNRISLGEILGELYDEWALTWLAQGQLDGSPANASWSALAATERSRAQALLGLVRDSISTDQPGADLAAEGVGLARAVTRSGAAALYYLATRDTLLVWVLSPSGSVTLVRRPVPRDSLAVLIGDMRRGFDAEAGPMLLAARGLDLDLGSPPAESSKTPVGRTWSDAGRDLAALLLPAQVQEQVRNVREIVIVPQGALALVPFAALPLGSTREALGSRYALRYATSLATLAQSETRAGLPPDRAARKSALSRALVAGNPSMPEVTGTGGARSALSSLPGAEAEGREIAAQLGTTALFGGAATESEIRRRLPAAPLVHLATHGFAYSTEARARQSFIALAPDGNQDGRLSVGEILDDPTLSLSAELIVLSACQTGLGDLKQAEGTVGLQRALLARGARSVLVSLWSVSDVATQKLMIGFYRHWLEDSDQPSKAEALRRSQDEVRKTPGFEHPRYWAAFQLVGAR